MNNDCNVIVVSPGLTTVCLIKFVSQAMKGLQYQTVLPEFTVLQSMVEKILPNSLRARLNSHYR